MASAKMTLIGMYNYDNTLFANLTMPEGIEKDNVINCLLLQGGEFEVLYARPEFMKYAIGVWSMKWERTFSEWLKGTSAEFNPIFNYDRFEEYEDVHKGTHSQTTEADYKDVRTADLEDKRLADLTDTRSEEYEDERTPDIQEKRIADLTDTRAVDMQDKKETDLKDKTLFNNSDTTSQLEQSSTEHKVAAYDSNTYQPSSQDVIDNGSSRLDHGGSVEVGHSGSETELKTGPETTSHTGSDTTKTSGTESIRHSASDTVNTTGTDTTKHTGTDETRHSGRLADVTGADDSVDKHKAHLYGNIGVTTSAAMLKEFYEISKWNLYEHICDVFISELLIPVY